MSKVVSFLHDREYFHWCFVNLKFSPMLHIYFFIVKKAFGKIVLNLAKLLLKTRCNFPCVWRFHLKKCKMRLQRDWSVQGFTGSSVIHCFFFRNCVPLLQELVHKCYCDKDPVVKLHTAKVIQCSFVGLYFIITFNNFGKSEMIPVMN